MSHIFLNRKTTAQRDRVTCPCYTASTWQSCRANPDQLDPNDHAQRFGNNRHASSRSLYYYDDSDDEMVVVVVAVDRMGHVLCSRCCSRGFICIDSFNPLNAALRVRKHRLREVRSL